MPTPRGSCCRCVPRAARPLAPRARRASGGPWLCAALALIPAGALALGRVRQTNKPGMALRLMEMFKAAKAARKG